jgi:hypothetical protein
MSGRITESFRQRKAGVERSSSGKKEHGKGSSTDLPTGVTPDGATDSECRRTALHTLWHANCAWIHSVVAMALYSNCQHARHCES